MPGNAWSGSELYGSTRGDRGAAGPPGDHAGSEARPDRRAAGSHRHLTGSGNSAPASQRAKNARARPLYGAGGRSSGSKDSIVHRRFVLIVSAWPCGPTDIPLIPAVLEIFTVSARLRIGVLRFGTSSACPYCGAADVRRSRRRGIVERLLRGSSVASYRCRRCLHRFLARRAKPEAMPEPLLEERTPARAPVSPSH